MTYDEFAVLDAIRGFGPRARVPRKSIIDKTHLSADRVEKALKGLDDSGHVVLDGDIARTTSEGTTFDT
ncbi:MAG: hypothetical protein IPK81_10495 [Rhodospirillales bacterium]|nr:hypothetical protein [Rhodospirillales bacterium]QQS14543.1 MAG: hypothetical protein IPK81_10495 [Rhodospirillales bacterium]